MNFTSNEGFFEKKCNFQKIQPKWLESTIYWHFSGHFLVTYAVLDLGKEQYYQVEMALKPPNFLLKSRGALWQ